MTDHQLSKAQAAYDAREPPEYWEDSPCDCCKEDSCKGCEHADEDFTCPQCHGTGMDWDFPCDKCDGEGRLDR